MPADGGTEPAQMPLIPPPPEPFPGVPRRRVREKAPPATCPAPSPTACPAACTEYPPLSPRASPMAETGFFRVQCLPTSASPDPRCELEGALHTLAAALRSEPTIPGDPADADRPWEAALREDTAVELPAKHCAFKGCSWSGTDEVGLQDHLRTVHRDALRPVAALLPKMHSEAEQYSASYEEAIAVAVRRGAPLAAYSIDQRCLYNYASCLGDGGPQSLVCFSCARRLSLHTEVAPK